MNQMFAYETKAGVEAVTDTALTYQLLSQYTAFVAVSDDVRVEPGSESVSMNVPVEMPEGVSYQGIFGQAATSYGSLAAMPAPEIYSANSRHRAPSAPGAGAQSFFSPLRRISPNSVEPEETFDCTLINPELLNDEESLSAAAAPIHHQIQVISVTGLDQVAIAALTQHLQQINLPSGFNGQIVLELTVGKGRIRGIMLCEKASTLKEAKVIELIQRGLRTWRPALSATSTVVLTLRIQS